MTVVLILMLASMFFSWVGFCWSWEERPNLKVALASASTRVLAGGVVVLTAMMPAVVCGARACRADYFLMLPIIYGLEAAICVVMLVVKARCQTRIRDEWQSRMWATTVLSGMV